MAGCWFLTKLALRENLTQYGLKTDMPGIARTVLCRTLTLSQRQTTILLLPPPRGFALLPLDFEMCTQLIQRMGSKFARWPFKQARGLRLRRHPELHKTSI